MLKNYISKINIDNISCETKSQLKQHIRTRMLKIRTDLSSDFIKNAEKSSLRLISDFINEISCKKGSLLNIMSYMSFKNEFPTVALNHKILASNHRLVLPFTDSDFNIRAFYIDSIGELAVSPLGIMEPDPKTCQPALLDEVDVIFMPGVAFDKKGSRIGFGKGCYDRFLSQNTNRTILAALAYDFQITENIPAEPTDVPCGYIITEKEIFKIKST